MRHAAAAVPVTLALVAGAATAAAPQAHAWQPPPIRSCGATASDAAMARSASPRIHSAGLSGVSADQIACARQIIGQVKGEGLDRQAGLIALITAITESGLHNYLGGDRDSLGLFQQRPSMGWGSRAQILDPAYSTRSFLSAMKKRFPGGSWARTDPGAVAQAVQRSAYPSRYDRERGSATTLLSVLWSGVSRPSASSKTHAAGGASKGSRTTKSATLRVPGTGIRVRTGTSTTTRMIRMLRGGTSVTASCERQGQRVTIGRYRTDYWMYVPAVKGWLSEAAMNRSTRIGLPAC